VYYERLQTNRGETNSLFSQPPNSELFAALARCCTLLEIGVGFPTFRGNAYSLATLRVGKSYVKCWVRFPTSINLRQMVGLNVDFPTFRGTESKGYNFLPKEPTLCMLRCILLTLLARDS
jgi:hypothetical protein